MPPVLLPGVGALLWGWRFGFTLGRDAEAHRGAGPIQDWERLTLSPRAAFERNHGLCLLETRVSEQRACAAIHELPAGYAQCGPCLILHPQLRGPAR